jgi:hypothetical protein
MIAIYQNSTLGGNISPSYLTIQDSASRKRVSTKTLIEYDTMDGEGRAKQEARAENGCSIVEINNAGDDPLSPCPMGGKLEKKFSVSVLDKVPTRMWDIRVMQEQLPRITSICVLRLALIS